MKIALIGYGKMGKLLHQLAEEKGHTICVIIHSKNLFNHSNLGKLEQAEICIDFSTPKSVLKNVEILSSLKKNIVMGTTGWNEQFHAIEKIVKTSEIGFLYSANFSLGVAYFLKIVEQAAQIMASSHDYEVAGMEMHHRMKLDSPSGTAKTIEKKLNLYFSKTTEFSSIRVGNIPGTHSVIFDSFADTITLTHAARNREGFAKGALTAAEWLIGKKGIFTIDDLLKGKAYETL